MSQTIEERVVRMDFDNKRFEQNVQQSLGTVDKLNGALNFSGVNKGAENLNRSLKGLNFGAFGDAVDGIKLKFSALEVAAITAISNITNTVINAGKRMVSEFTLDPIKEGFAEYELKLGSVQTIMASTGADLKTVNEYLNELNTYADKTIYSFSDMTSSIGKFTNAGVDLESAVKAIQGISNEAAVSGANAEQASHAMYNFAQALSSGSVRLTDWKSIEIANMATVEFKQHLIDTAVELGTLTKQGDKYISTTKDLNGHISEAFNTTTMFNDSLSSQWMTTDVLVKTLGEYADETTEIGKKAFAAAQDVKTFSQLMDTLKEAVGSGWATTFEILFGDFEEAKQLWTEVNKVVGGFVDRTSDARNEMLSMWDSLGGRASLLKSLNNIFNALLSVVKPIGEAFREIFPKTTASRLVEITKHFQNFTAKLRLSESNMGKLHTVFLGVFSVLDIVGRAFKAVAIAISPLINVITALGQAFLDLGSELGLRIFNFDLFLKETNALEKVANSIKSTFSDLSPVFSKCANVFNELANVIKTFVGGVFQNFSKHLGIVNGDIHTFEESIGDIADAIGKKLAKSLPALETFADIVSNTIIRAFDKFKMVGEALKTVFVSVKDGLAQVFGSADFNTLIDIANGGLLALLIGSLHKLFDTISKSNLVDLLGYFKDITGFKDLKEGLVDALDAARTSLAKFQTAIEIKALKEIAIAVAILAGALFVLATIPSEKLTVSLAAVGGLLAELMGAMKAMDVMGSFKGFSKTAAGMVVMSSAILILSVALKSLSSIDSDKLGWGMTAITMLLTELVIVSEILQKTNTSLVSGSVGLIAFAIAVNILASAVGKLGGMDIATLAKGLVSVAVLMGSIAGFTQLLDTEKLLSAGIGLIAVATAINIMAVAVGTLGAMDIATLVAGLTSMAVILGEIAIFTNILKPESMIATGIGMNLIGASLLIFAQAISNLGELDVASLIKGLTSIGVILAEIGIFTKLVDANKLLAIGPALVVVSVGMNGLAKAISKLGNMSAAQLAKGLIAIGTSLVIFAVGANAMKGTLAGAAAMVVVAAALNLLAPPLILLGKMKLTEIGVAIAGLAATIGTFAAAAVLLSPAIAPMLALAGAMALLGVACVGIGAGLALAAVGLSTLGTAITTLANKSAEDINKFVKNVGEIAKSILDLIPELLGKFLDGLKEVIPKVVETGTAIILSLLSAFDKLLPAIFQSGITLILTLLNAIVTVFPSVVKTGITLILELLKGLSQNMHALVTAGVRTVTEFINGIADNIDPVITAGINLIGAIVIGLIRAIPQLFSKGCDIISEVLKGLDSMTSNLREAGKNAVQGFINGILAMPGQIARAGSEIAGKLLSSVKSKLNIHSPSKAMEKIGRYAIMGLVIGVEKMEPAVMTTAGEVGSGMAQRMFDSINNTLNKTLSSKGFSGLQKIFSFISKSYEKNVDKYLQKMISDRIAPQYLTSAMVAYTKAVLDNANKIYKSYTSLLSKLDKDTKRFVLSMPEVTVAYIQNVGDVTQYAASSIKQFTSQYSKALKSSGVNNVKGVAAGAIQSFATKLYLNSDEYKQSMSNLRSYYQENEKLEARRAKQSEKLKSLEQDRTKSVKEINKLKKAEANNAKNVSAKESEIKAIEEELAQIERDKRSDNLAALENERAQLDVKKKKNQAAALDKRIEAAKNANYKADLMDRKKALQSELKQLKTNQKNAEKNTKNAKDGLKDINKSIKETKKNINSIDKEIAQNNKKVEKEATRIAQGAMKALKKYRKELRGMVKDFMSISNIATEKLITGFSAIMPSTNLATEMTRNFDFLGVTFEKVASAAENVTEASSEATEEMVDGLSDVAETLDLFNVKFDTGIDLFTKFTKTGSAEVQALFEHADSALEAYNEYQSGLEQMRAMGFDEALISELENKGMDSINYVRGFLKMNESEVDQYNQRINKKAEWESKKIASEMNKELATYENWVNNIEELAARGLSEGIINKLKDGGVGQAAFVSALVAADDTTLSKIDELYSGYVYTNYEIALNQPQDVYSDYVETETETAVDTAETGGEAVATSFKEALYKEMNDKSDYENKLDFVKMVGLDDRIIEELREKGHEAGSAIVDSIIEEITGGKDVSISDIVKINELRKQESELKSVVDEGVKNLENLSTQRNKALANLDRLERDRANPKYIDAARKEYEKINDAYNDNLYTVQKASQEYIKTKEKLYELSNSYSILSESVKEYNDIYNKSINQGKSPAEKWLEDMQTTLNTKKDWDKNLKKIAKSEGEDSAIYQQIKDMGWEAGSEYAAAYLAADKQTKKELRASAEEIAKINRDNIVATYKERNNTVLQMAEDLENITNRTVKPGLEKSKQAMLDEMSTWGPDMAEQMAVIASLDDKQFDKVVSTYKAGTGKTASAFADTFISSLSMAFSGMEEGLNSLGINTITGISNGLNNEDAKNKLKKSSTKVANDVISPIKNTLKISSPSKVMITVGKNVLAGLSNGLSQTANVIKVAKGVSEDVKDALKTYLNKAKGQQIGENVVAGIASGMTSKSSMSAIAEAAATLAESVVSSLQEELEIESPSKVLRDEVGIFVGFGVSEGIMASENSVKSASESLGDSTINALKEAFDRAKRIIDSEIEFDPVITPTLDLSNVRNRAKTLNSMIASVDANVYGSSYDDASTNNPLNQNDGMTFIQNNYSPKALDQLEIFRQTRNQFAMVRNIVGAV